MNGCCYGHEVSWGIAIPERHEFPPIPRHPTQLYEVASALLIGAFLLWLLPRRKFRGQVWFSYVALYAAARFTVEFWRDDPRGKYGPLMTSQWIALALFPIGVAAWFYQRKRGTIPLPSQPAPEVAAEKA